MNTRELQLISTEESRKRAEAIMADLANDPTYRKSRPTKEFCIAELKIDTYSVDQMLRDMQRQINATIAELLAEVKEGEKLKAVQVLWKNVLDREKNPDSTVGHWVVIASKLPIPKHEHE